MQDPQVSSHQRHEVSLWRLRQRGACGGQVAMESCPSRMESPDPPAGDFFDPQMHRWNCHS